MLGGVEVRVNVRVEELQCEWSDELHAIPG
jgi:hypothetical protein